MLFYEIEVMRCCSGALAYMVRPDPIRYSLGKDDVRVTIRQGWYSTESELKKTMTSIQYMVVKLVQKSCLILGVCLSHTGGQQEHANRLASSLIAKICVGTM